MFDTSPDGIKKIISKGESQKVEFKSRFPSDHIISMVLAAFANTEGGILLIGVGDKGEIIGVSPNEMRKDIERLYKISKSLLPTPIKSGFVEIQGNDIFFIVIDKAPKSYIPIMVSRGDIYMRYSDQIRSVSQSDFEKPEEIEKISRIKRGKEITAFVAMSFREEEEPALVDYFKAMQRAVAKTQLPLKLNRVDLVEGDYEISKKIMDEIDKSQIVIADFTLNTRNVYFEMGYARGKKRRIIQLARKDTPLEFDVRNWRTLFYRNATELEEKIVPALKVAYADIIDKES